MINTINAGVIGCDMTKEFFDIANRAEKLIWKKAYAGFNMDGIAKKFPELEIVNNVKEIVTDNDITLVIVSAENLKLARPALAAGKSVRII